jgi:hypothetical protein
VGSMIPETRKMPFAGNAEKRMLRNQHFTWRA